MPLFMQLENRRSRALIQHWTSVELLEGLKIIEHSQTVADSVRNVLPLAREYDLSAYDAATPIRSPRMAKSN
jgi:hypothetical protein